MSKINAACAAIQKYGTPLQRQIISSIQKSSICIMIENISGSGSCGVTDTAATQQRINSQKINELQALGELTIRINPVTESNNVSLEGTLVHETRHAYHLARAISEFSYVKDNPYDPDRFTREYAAHQAYGEYVLQVIRLNHPDKQAFINESLTLKVTKKVGNRIEISDAGIRARLLNSYGVNDTTARGQVFSDRYKIYPKNSW